jgi:UV DNA damage endonuclease
MIKKGVCCIVLALEPLKFRTITYKSFSSLPRELGLAKLGEIIEHNMDVTAAAIAYCGEHNLNYRISSSLFPLITYDKAEVKMRDLPNFFQILAKVQNIKHTREKYPDTRLSIHPDQFNVLASENQDAVTRTIRELDFYSDFMNDIGCYDIIMNPINIHMNANGDWDKIADKFVENYSRLKLHTRMRLVLENDDKASGWSVKKLDQYMKPRGGFPITFDYLHHKCHPDGLTEEEAFNIAYESWGPIIRPLFHYSESAPDQNNPRKHADYATRLPDTYGKSIDLDFEFKLKEKSFENL